MTPNVKNQTRPYISEGVTEIALDALNPADCLLIKTAESTYCFMVDDPASRRGVLMGGALGGAQVATVLLGAEIRQNGQVSALFSKLCEGACGIFFVASPDGVKQLVTSAITKLIYTRAKTPHQSELPACADGDDNPHPISS